MSKIQQRLTIALHSKYLQKLQRETTTVETPSGKRPGGRYFQRKEKSTSTRRKGFQWETKFAIITELLYFVVGLSFLKPHTTETKITGGQWCVSHQYTYMPSVR